MARTPTTTDAFNAVAEASRRQLLDAIGVGEVTVGELVDRLGFSQPQVSKHLACCGRSASCSSAWTGVIAGTGSTVRRCKPIHDWVRTFERTWNIRLDRLDDLLVELQSQEDHTMTTTSNRHGSAAVTLPSDTEILITRQFDAPASLVFKAFTTPSSSSAGGASTPRSGSSATSTCARAARGATSSRRATWRSASTASTGRSTSPDRLVSTEAFEGLPMGITDDPDSVARQHHDARRGRRCHDDDDARQARHQEHRDGHIQSGMEGGMQISFNRLEDVVAELAQA